MKTDKQNNNLANLNSLISKLKKEDANYATIVRAIQIIYWLLIPLIVIATIRKYLDSHLLIIVVSGFCKVLALVIFALFFRNFQKEYKLVDYSLPTIQMLKKAVYRYQPIQKKSLWILIPLILIDISLTLDWQDHHSILQSQLTFWGLILLGAFIGLILWFVKYKPIRDEAQHLINELEGE